jgi:dihydroflavonol-4-reductase
VAKTLITGGSGFVGSHLARALAARGDELRLLLRDPSRAEHLFDLDFETALGDITDRGSVRKALKGVDRVFHVAGTTSHRSQDREKVFEINAGGTRIVTEEALRAGVERLVHTSSSAGVGPAEPGETVDESQVFTAGHLGIAYMNSKHEAETEALRAAAKGLPVVIVNPSFVLGPDDPSGTSNELVRRFLSREIPVYVDGGLNVVDVRDVADGHLLADQRGAEGERYILGGQNFTLQRLFADLGRIADIPPPAMKLPGQLASSAVAALERAGLPFPAHPDEVKAGTLWWTYRNDKAKRELGFAPRPWETTLAETVDWQLEHLDGAGARERATDAAMRAGGVVSRLGSRVPRPRIPFRDR